MSALWFILVILGGAVILLVVIMSIVFAERVIRQPRETHPNELGRYGLRGESITFFSRDGLKLVGALFGGTNGATIILLHGFSRSKEQMLPHAAFLNHAGFNVLLFDFRASGQSEGGFITFGQKEQYDLEGAVKFLKNRSDIDSQRIGIFGFSMGGAVAVLKSAEIPEVKAIVLDSTFSRMKEVIQRNFREYLPHIPFFPIGYLVLVCIRLRTGVYFPHINPVRAIGRLTPRPVLIIHGTRDEKIPTRHAEELMHSAKGDVSVWIIPGADHHGTYRTAGKQYEERVIEFFSTHLLK